MRSLPLESPEIEQSTLAAWSLHLGRPVTDPVALRRDMGSGSIPEAVAVVARRRPREPVFTVRDDMVTHSKLDDMAGRVAAALALLGVVSGSRVALIADVGVEEIAAYLGVLRLGAIAVLMNPTLTGFEMKAMITGTEAEVIVGSGPGLMKVPSSGAPSVREVVGLRAADRETGVALIDDLTDAVHPVDRVAPGATALLAFTSGSTGLPKPTPLSHRNLLASVRGAMAAWRWSEGDHLVHSLPISHQHGLSGVNATLLAGSRATLLGGFDAEKLLLSVESGATVHFGVPALYQRLLDTLDRRTAHLGKLRLAVSGSGPLPIELARRYLDDTGQSLLERYGTTESGLNVSNLYGGDRVPGQVGLPLPGVEIALVDETGSLVGEGQTGEIVIRGPHVFTGYLGEGVVQPFFGDWFRTGDLGHIDPVSGFLVIAGRLKDVIITGGMNVYPKEIEDVMRRHLEVSDVVVMGVASDGWGEEVVAVVSPASVDRGELFRLSIEHLAPYKRPKRVVLVDNIPRSPLGKPLREHLLGLIPPGGAGMPPAE